MTEHRTWLRPQIPKSTVFEKLIVTKPVNKYPAICLTRYFTKLYLVLDASLLLRSASYYYTACPSVRTCIIPRKRWKDLYELLQFEPTKAQDFVRVKILKHASCYPFQQRAHSCAKLYFTTVCSLTMGQWGPKHVEAGVFEYCDFNKFVCIRKWKNQLDATILSILFHLILNSKCTPIAITVIKLYHTWLYIFEAPDDGWV